MASSRKLFSLFGSLVISGLAESKKELTAFEKDVRKLNRDLNNLGRDMNKVGKIITTGITAPLLGAASAAVLFGADFDEAMTKSIAIMDDVDDSMRTKLEQTARDVAKDLNMSVESMGEAYFFLASAGLDAAESMAALPKVAAFAKAGNFDMAKATDLLTDSQSALGLSSENTAEHIENMVMISDQLIEANKNANASAEQFSEALTNKAGVALKSLNKDLSEGLAVLQVFADKGFAKGLKAGEKFDILLRDLQDAAEKNAGAFDLAGIAVFDDAGKMNNMADIVEGLTGHLSTMSDEQKRSELRMLGFRSESVSVINAMLGTSDAIRGYEESLKNAGGATNEVAQKQLKSFWQQIGKVQKKVIDLGLTLFKALSPILLDVVVPALNAVVDAVASLFEWFGKHQILTTFIASFAALMAVAGPIILAFVQFLPLIKSLLVMYKAWTVAQIGLNTAMTKNPIALWTVGIALLIAAGVALWKNWDVVSEKFTEVWGGIASFFKIVAGSIGLGFNNLILGILKGVNKVGKYIPGLNKGLDKTIKALEKNGKELEKWTDAAAAANEERKATISLNKAEKKAVEEATKAAEEKAKADKEATEEEKKLTLEQLKAAKALAEKRGKFEADYTERVAAMSRNRIQVIEAERAEALKAASKLGADKTKLNEFYNAKVNTAKAEAQLEALKAEQSSQATLEQSRIDLMDSGIARLQAETSLRVDKLEQQKAEAVRIAEETGGDVDAIRQSYANKRLLIEKNAAAEEIKLARKVANEKKGKLRSVLSVVSDVAGAISSIWQVGLEKRSNQIEEERAQQVLAVEASVISEEDKANAITAINEEADEKKRAIQRENAVREKAAAILGIALSTAVAVAAALPNIPLSIVVGVLGLVQLGIAAAQPIPFAEGGLVRSSIGKGVIAQVGEGNQDEIVLPMKTGAAELADNMMSRLGGKAGAFANGAVSNSRKIVKEVHNHFHFGTVIADELGLKKLSKTLNKYSVAEAQRTGE